MPWTEADQAAATTTMNGHIEDVSKKYSAYISAVSGGGTPSAAANALSALKEAMSEWQTDINLLRTTSDTLASNEQMIDDVNQLVASMSEEKALLKKLRSEAVTRGDQASSVNPKVTASPYTNILGLQRTFKGHTRTNITIAAILFGVLASSTAVFMVYRVATQGLSGAMPASYPGVVRGGARR